MIICFAYRIVDSLIIKEKSTKGKADDRDDDGFEAVLHLEGPLSNANFLLRGGTNLLKEKW